MTCNLSEIRRQLEDMQTLLDTYEHCHVDRVTPEEKIIEKVKAKCVEAVDNKRHQYELALNRDGIYRGFDIAIKAITDVE